VAVTTAEDLSQADWPLFNPLRRPRAA